MNDFMKDRYGVDELTALAGSLGVLLALVGSLTKFDPLLWIALLVIVIALLRAFSKNGAARRRENEALLSFSKNVPGLQAVVDRLGGAVGSSSRRGSTARASRAATRQDLERAKRTAKKMWKERKTSRFLKCPNCGQILSVPKGKGRIRVTCPKCRTKMETKS